jgi:hypothetical protein
MGKANVILEILLLTACMACNNLNRPERADVKSDV